MFLVTGATGALGGKIVTQLRERDWPVRMFVNLFSAYEELAYRGATPFIGDLRRERDIAKACQGVRYVISAHTGDAEALDFRANIDLIDQAKAHNVEHFVYLSVLGCDRGFQDGPTFKARREVEKYLAASGLNYTILRPPGLTSYLLPLAERVRETGIYVLLGDPLNRISPVSADDLARLAIASVNCEGARNQTLPVGGPEVLKRQDLPRILGGIWQREVQIINVPMWIFDLVRGGLGPINPAAQRQVGTLRTLLTNEFFCTPAEISRLESIYQLKLESLETYLRRYLSK
ncbi:MAG: SDR family oxidoreductase [Chloroflexaceae bacterium]|nr:SDR family oxidoreductase [Chloroflexaceae bacterium]